MSSLILIDEQNRAIGTISREEAHSSPGILHRAFSVYVFRKIGTEILVQRRSASKLSGGLWANTCCSHPREGEEIMEVAPRRLQEELGFTCALTPVGDFIYQAEDPHGKGAEHEHVTIFRGDLDRDVAVTPNPDEVGEWKWVSVDELRSDMEKNPDLYAPWFHIGLRALI